MYKLHATNKQQDGGTHFATLLTTTGYAARCSLHLSRVERAFIPSRQGPARRDFRRMQLYRLQENLTLQ